MNIPNDGGRAAAGLRKCLKFERTLILFAWLVAGCGAQERPPHHGPIDEPPKIDMPITVGAEPKTGPEIETKDVTGKTATKPGIDPSESIVADLTAHGLGEREKPKGEPAKETEQPKEKDSPRKVENERIRANDEVLRSLETANIAFNAPESINIDDTARIQLLLSLEKTVAELKSQIEAEGKVEGAAVRVSDRMEAELTGSNFEITAITPEEQAVATAGDTEWRWDVKPKSAGKHKLHLTLTAILSIQGRDTRRMIKTFDKSIEIQVTPAQKLVGFFEKAWQWIWAAILVPIVGWLWTKWKSKSKTEAPIK